MMQSDRELAIHDAIRNSPQIYIYKDWMSKYGAINAAVLSLLAVRGRLEFEQIQEILYLSKRETKAHIKFLVRNKAIIKINPGPHRKKSLELAIDIPEELMQYRV